MFRGSGVWVQGLGTFLGLLDIRAVVKIRVPFWVP